MSLPKARLIYSGASASFARCSFGACVRRFFSIYIIFYIASPSYLIKLLLYITWQASSSLLSDVIINVAQMLRRLPPCFYFLRIRGPRNCFCRPFCSPCIGPSLLCQPVSENVSRALRNIQNPFDPHAAHLYNRFYSNLHVLHYFTHRPHRLQGVFWNATEESDSSSFPIPTEINTSNVLSLAYKHYSRCSAIFTFYTT